VLPAARHVLELYSGTAGSAGLLSVASPGTLFVDCSTIAVDDALSAHELAASAGHRCLEAPVSGGVAGAAAGTLTFMVGGSDSDFAQAGGLLDVMGSRTVYCGGPGAGQAAKICNNMILGISMIAVSEAFVLGERLGVSNEALFDVTSNASGQCWALTSNCPVPGPVPTSPANHDFRPGFATALMAKDLGLAANALASAGLEDVGLGGRATEMYRDFAEDGGAGQDFSAIINAIRAKSSESNVADQPTTPATDAA
jgi:3-hydroxyisobutyrate dehydrogenase